MTAFMRGFIGAWLWSTPIINDDDYGVVYADERGYDVTDAGITIRALASHCEAAIQRIMGSEYDALPTVSQHGQPDLSLLGYCCFMETSGHGVGLWDRAGFEQYAAPYRAAVGSHLTEDIGAYVDNEVIDTLKQYDFGTIIGGNNAR